MEAMHELGAWYGSGDIKTISKLAGQRIAYRYYKQAAKMGHAESQYDLGFMYWSGDLGEKNSEKALYWLRKAADQGYHQAVDFIEAIE